MTRPDHEKEGNGSVRSPNTNEFARAVPVRKMGEEAVSEPDGAGEAKPMLKPMTGASGEALPPGW
jgi:hypothetical protein